MATVGDQVRIRVEGSRLVDAHSPLEMQVQEVYKAAHRIALGSGFKPHVHHGPYGARQGRMGNMVLSNLVKQVLQNFDNDDHFKKVYGLINQVLRKTDAAVCLRQPKHRAAGTPVRQADLPLWFVADQLPENIVVVALSYSKTSAGIRPYDSSEFDEDAFLTPREKRLADEEVKRDTGEPVRVTTLGPEPHTSPNPDPDPDPDPAPAPAEPTEQPGPGRGAHLKARHATAAKERERLAQRVFEEVQTSPVPLTARDLTEVINNELGTKWSLSVFRDLMHEMLDDGRVVSRLENINERAVRGGGSLPKGRAMLLYWPAPGPVPERTQLPSGVEPYRAAQGWVEGRETLLEDDAKLVEKALWASGYKHQIRTRGQISRETGLTVSRVSVILDKLLEENVVYQNKNMFFVSERAMKHGPKSKTEVTPKHTDTPGFTPEPEDVIVQPTPPQTPPEPVTHSAPPAPPADEDRNLQLVLELADRLGVDLPAQDTETDPRDVDELESQLSEAQETIAKLRRQVSALKQAISNME